KDSKDGDGKNGEARDGSTSNGASGKNKTNGNHFAGGSDDWTEPDLTVPKKKSIFTGWDGLAVSIAGIVLPTLVVGLGVLSIPKRLTLVLLN
ncbi:hypothetical protein, partial [Klebsiella pneumoniae]|uniref:hypothetical protein n=1 Tax=Klebsiella pneumoniae TaxID=573 RepID=UPI003B987FAE